MEKKRTGMEEQTGIVWHDWQDEAFERARREGKPVFLMIGFASCRWCRKQWAEMRQSAALRDLLARRVVCVAVDRDLRPDLDAAYCAARDGETGVPGWPLLALLTPGRLPFYLSGYRPAGELLDALRVELTEWESERDKPEARARARAEAARALYESIPEPATPTKAILEKAAKELLARFDPQTGGFDAPPAFPMPLRLRFLLRQGALTRDGQMVEAALCGLRRLCEGAIFDHVGGGVFRYALDGAWHEPEREKTLADNALFAEACLEGWLISREEMLLVAAERSLGWMLREMRGARGAFFAAQCEDEENVFSLSRKDLTGLLGEGDGTAFCVYYGIEEEGIPSRMGHEGIETPRMLALGERVWRWRREARPLFCDVKRLAMPNALAVRALCFAYDATGRMLYRDAALEAGAFLRDEMTLPQGLVAACHPEDAAHTAGTLDDTAQTACAALALYAVTLEGVWLDWAVRLCRAMLGGFARGAKPGLAMTPAGAEKPFARPVETYDGALASGNAAALEALVTLYRLDVGTGWREAAMRQAEFLTGFALEAPCQHTAALLSMLPLIYPARLLEARARPVENEQLLAALRGKYLPLLYRKAAAPSARGSRWLLWDGTGMPFPSRSLETILSGI